MDEQRQPPVLEARAPANRARVFASILATMFMISIEGTIVATAVPTIVGDLGGFDLFSWVFTAYLLAQAVTIPIYGRLADLYGRKKILFVGMAFFLTASLLCGLAPNVKLLMLFRALQGIGAGSLQPVCMTMIADLYNPAERARIQAIVSSVWVVGAFVGPLAGAFLIATTSWPMVFWINVPLGVLATVMLALNFRERVAPRRHRIDYLGSVLIVFGVGLLMFTLVQATHLAGATIAILIAISLAALVVLVIHERLASEPMLPINLWRNPIVLGGIGCNFVVGWVMMGINAFLPAYVQGVMGRSALAAGFMLTAMAAAWPTGSAIAGMIVLRTSYRTVAAAGGICLIIGCALLAMIAPDRSTSFVVVAALFIGFGMGLGNNSFLVAVQTNVGPGEIGIATSSVVFMRMIGQSVGTALFGGIVNAALSPFAAGPDIVDRMLMPALRATIAPETLAPLLGAFAGALEVIHLVSVALAIGLFGCAFLLPRGLNPLRGARR